MKSTTKSQVYEDEVYKISVNNDLAILRLTWKQHPTSEQYRKGYRQAIFYAIEYNMKYWLTDSRQIPYLHMADQHWMYTKMRPLLKGGKILRFAIVLEPETLMMTDRQPILESQQLIARPQKLFQLEFFLDVGSACAWLTEFSRSF